MQSSPFVSLRSLDIFSGYLLDLQLAGQDLEQLKQLAQTARWHQPPNFRKKLLTEKRVILVTDLKQRIVFASHNLLGMNQYKPAQVLGQSPKMFQGEKTCPETRRRIHEAVTAYQPFKEKITNYKRNGASYECSIEAQPLLNGQGSPVHFVAFEWLA